MSFSDQAKDFTVEIRHSREWPWALMNTSNCFVTLHGVENLSDADAGIALFPIRVPRNGIQERRGSYRECYKDR